MKSKVEYFPDVLSFVRVHEQIVDWNVVVQVASGIEALTLHAGDLDKIGLSCHELASLVDIGCKVRPISSERHVKTGNQQHKIEDSRTPDQSVLGDLNLQDIKKQPEIADDPCDGSESPQRLRLRLVIGVAEERAVKVHDSVEVIMLLQVLVGKSTLEGVAVWQLHSAQVLVEVVARYPVHERRH